MILDFVKSIDNRVATFKLSGKLNSVSSTDFRDQVYSCIQDCDEVILDFTDLHYVASAGLRVILEIHKALLAQKKKFTIYNADEGTMEVLKATGLSKFLNIK